MCTATPSSADSGCPPPPPSEGPSAACDDACDAVVGASKALWTTLCFSDTSGCRSHGQCANPIRPPQADYIKAYLTFATQLLLIIMLFMGIDMSQFGIFQQSFLISLTVTAIVISIVKGQVENHMAFRSTFLDGTAHLTPGMLTTVEAAGPVAPFPCPSPSATLSNHIVLMDFFANVVMAVFVVCLQRYQGAIFSLQHDKAPMVRIYDNIQTVSQQGSFLIGGNGRHGPGPGSHWLTNGHEWSNEMFSHSSV
jgi:hypothetical protein